MTFAGFTGIAGLTGIAGATGFGAMGLTATDSAIG